MMIDDVVCGICCDVVPGHPVTSMVCCKKKVHAYCVSQWLDTQSSCIYCRAVVTSIIVDGAVIPFASTSGAALIDSKVHPIQSKVKNPSSPSSSSQSEIGCREHFETW